MNCKKCHKKMIFKAMIGSIRFFRCSICDCITSIKDGGKRIDYYKEHWSQAFIECWALKNINSYKNLGGIV